MSKLTIIKIAHTVIWAFFVAVLIYLFYAVITNRIDYLVWICIGLIFLEGITLLIFKMACPLTLIARNYSDSTRENFDIFLPKWLAKNNKLIFTTFFLITLLLLAWRMSN